MIKKIFSFLLAMIMAVSLFAATAVSASAIMSSSFSFKGTNASSGGEAIVDVKLVSSDLVGFRFEIDYDTTKLTLKNVVRTQEFIDAYKKNSPTFMFTKSTTTVLFIAGNPAVGVNNFNGVALQLIFDVKDDAPCGNTKITVSKTPHGSYNGPEASYYYSGSLLSNMWSNTPSCNVNINNTLTDLDVKDSSIDLEIGTPFDLNDLLVFTPASASDKSITWTSSAPWVAYVDNNTGMVTPVSKGAAKITGVSNDNPSLSVSVTINVSPPVSEISLPDTESIMVGDKKSLDFTYSPSDATLPELNWESLDQDVATVDDNGVVTGIKEGETVITVASADGKLTAECLVTVGAVADITVPVETFNITMGENVSIPYTVVPAYLSDTVTFSSSNDSVVSVNNDGKAVGVRAGKAVITVQAGDVTKTFNVTVHNYITLKIDSPIAIHNGVTTTLDNQDTKPFLVNGRTMVPLRFIGEKMGGTVKYVSDKDPIIVSYGDITVSVTLDSNQMIVTGADGESSTIILDAPVCKRGSRTFVPLRAISQSLGFSVTYQSVTNYIVVNDPVITSSVLALRYDEAKKIF